jgi:hypothetical protein
LAWTCSVCGEQHGEQLLDVRAGLPEAVFALTDAEREERAEVWDDWCRFVDGTGRTRFYLRGVIHLPVHESTEEFRFGVWVEVGEGDFYRLTELWHDEDGSPTRPFFGQLANELNLYPGTLGLPVALQLRDQRHLPGVILLDADHRIVSDQREGIDMSRVQQLAETVLH